MERRDFIKTGIGVGVTAGLIIDPLKAIGLKLDDDVRQIIIRTSWSNSNIGEIASLQASQNTIQRGLPRAKIYLWPAKKNDAYVEAMKDNNATLNIIEGDINESNEPDNQELKDLLETSDLLIWIGGNIQDEVQNKSFADSFDEFNRVLSYCRSINLKYGIYGTSFNQLSAENSETIKPILGHSSFIFTRESGSYDIVKDLKTECKKVDTGTDINFNYDFISIRLATEYITSLGLNDSDFVTLIIKTNLDSIGIDEKRNICSRLSGNIKDFIIEHEIPFIILPSDLGEVEISRQYIYEPLKEELGDKLHFIEQFLTPNIIHPIIDKSRFIISMDISTLVLSYTVGTPGLHFFLPEFGNENSLITDLGLKDWSIDLKESEDDDIKKALTQIHKKYVAALVQVGGVRKQVYKKQDTFIQTAGKLLYPDKGKKKKKKKKK